MTGSTSSWAANVPLIGQGYHQQLLARADRRRCYKSVYPPTEQTFRALESISFEAVRVVILGQDPYHRPGQADGLAFSVPEGIVPPPSLRNVFKEIVDDVYSGRSTNLPTDLSRWARQGVLLLNASFTVEEGDPGSHSQLGWHMLTDEIVACLGALRVDLVYLLWGAHARIKRELVPPDKHLVLEAAHPSPLSARRGFFGCRHFSRANEFLMLNGGDPICW